MNPKLIELYKKAHVPDIAIDPSNNMQYETMSFSAEEFAKVIVLGCADVAASNGDSDLIGIIKEHFGVE